MTNEIDYARLSYEELQALIREEEAHLATLKTDLTLAQARKAEIEAAIVTEHLPVFEERTKRRIERIQRYEKAVSELESQIRRFDERIKSRSDEVKRLEARVKELEARLPRLDSVERYITRETITRLTRTLAGLKAWQTRDMRYLEFLKSISEHNRRILAGLKSWQIREEPLIKRLEQLRAALATTIAEIERLKTEITKEEAHLKEKRKHLPKFYKSHCIISVVYKEEKKMFEVHEIINHLEPEPPKEVATRLALELLLDYFAVEAIEESGFLKKSEFIYGEVQTFEVHKLNAITHGVIIDVKSSGRPVRRCYEIKWYVETTLEGERRVRIESFKEVTIKSEKQLKEEWEKLVKEEA
jgi:chromosome segregation ATPase